MAGSVTRVVVTAGLMGAIILAGSIWWNTSEVSRLRRENAELEAEMTRRVAERDAMIARLSRSRRVAHLQVEHQQRGPSGQVERSDVVFIELDDAGRELGRQMLSVPGEYLFIDAWIAKFEPRLVAEGHPLLGRSLILLRRAYSDRMKPEDGIPIDTPGAVPKGYAGSEQARFEQVLWEQFWAIASDPARARAMGIRAAQGEAVYQRLEEGKEYELTIENAGGMSFVRAE